MKKFYPQLVLWAGTDESFAVYQAAYHKFYGLMPAQAGGTAVTPSTPTPTGQASSIKSRLLSVDNNVALLSIHGVTVNTDNWWNEHAGLVSYNEIRAAALEALALVQAGRAKEVLVDVSSPGGAVAGVKDAADALVMLRKSVRTTAYTDSVAASAGYWLYAAAGRQRFASAVAQLGSIGVILKHFEYSKYFEEEGVGATVIRSGEYKQLANEIEPLSEKAKADLQAKSDHIYGVFVDSIAELLNVSSQLVRREMADGREFIGSQAVDVGLVEEIKSFDQVYAGIVKRTMKAEGGADMSKKYTASAVTLEAAASASGSGAAGEAGGVVSQDTNATPESGLPTPSGEAGATTASPDAPRGEAEPAAEVVELTARVAELEKQLKVTLETFVVQGSEKLALEQRVGQLSEEVSSLKAEQTTLTGIVAKHTNTMMVAAGLAEDSKLAELSTAELLKRYEHASSLHSQLPVGGVAMPTPELAVAPAPSQQKAPLSVVEKARLRVVKAQTR